MLITVIKTATLPVKTSQMPSIVDERHISDGNSGHWPGYSRMVFLVCRHRHLDLEAAIRPQMNTHR
jgi:hypothetical protein